MTTTVDPTATLETPGVTERKYPPVAHLMVVALALIVTGGVLMASYAPRRPPLAAPTALFVASLIVFAVAIVMIARIPNFAWKTFRLVAGWALVAYVISAGMIELAFVHNDTRGAPLLVLTLLIVMFAITVPVTIAYTVARYADE